MDKVRLRLNKDEATIVEGEDSFVGQLIAGTKGKVKINHPLMRREIHKLKDSKGKVLKDDKHPENIGKIEKKKKEK